MPKLRFDLPVQSMQSGRIGKYGNFYQNTKKKGYKAALAMYAITQLRGFKPIEGAVRVTRFDVYLQRPLSHYVNNDRSRPLKETAPIHCLKHIDVMDNLFKPFGDALNGIAWIDDSHICYETGRGKYWTDEPDHIILEFEEVQ